MQSPRRPEARPARLGWLMFWMSGTLIAFIVAALSVRALSNTLNAFEMMTIRSAGGLIILFAMGLASPALLRSVRMAPHAAADRAATWCISARRSAGRSRSRCCRSRPCSRSNSSFRPGSTLLAVLFLGERMTATRASALALCFVGVLVILRPGHEAFQPVALLMVVRRAAVRDRRDHHQEADRDRDRRSRSCSG